MVYVVEVAPLLIMFPLKLEGKYKLNLKVKNLHMKIHIIAEEGTCYLGHCLITSRVMKWNAQGRFFISNLDQVS